MCTVSLSCGRLALERESVQHSNIDETEMAQLHALHVHLNAIDAVRARIKTGISSQSCITCDAPIPKARQEAIQGCDTCISCQQRLEKYR